MYSYDFSQLDEHEFETLVNDLLEKVYDVEVDRFERGRDKWIDWKFIYENWKTAIIQTKHYLKTWYSWLISTLKNSELDKVKKLRKNWELDKYIFVTSVSLTDENRKEIKGIFHPYINSIKDIYSTKKLNSILSKNPDIEKIYYKLWINSSNVLDLIYNNSTLIRSRDELKIMAERSKMFVKISSFQEALERLEKDRVIIISWEPWIWKTTLSENICLKLISPEFWYKFIDIKDSIEKAENLWKDNEKQLFYFDDFLWSNYFEAIHNKQDSYIVSFIKRVNQDKTNTKLFILNSRTNILNYWKQFSPTFKNNNLDKNEFLLEIKSLTDYEKAYILYKHIYFSNLDRWYINEICKDKNYYKIIKHKNFKPRIIQFVTDINKLYNLKSDEYISYILWKLNNPEDIWADSFEIQSNEYIRSLVSLVVFNWWEIKEIDLINAYNFIKNKINYNSNIDYNFTLTINLALKSFINRNIYNNWEVFYSVFDPSISDYVLNKYIDDVDFLFKIYSSLNTEESLSKLHSIFWNYMFWLEKNIKKINFNNYKTLLKRLFDNSILDKSVNYRVYLIEMLDFDPDNLMIIQILNDFISNNIELKNEYSKKLMYLLNLYFDYLEIKNSQFVYHYLEYIDDFLDISEVENLLELFDKILDKDFNEIYDIDEIKDKIENFLCWEMLSIYEDLDVWEYINEAWGYLTRDSFDEDAIIESIKEVWYKIINENLSKYNFFKMLYIDNENLFDNLDISIWSKIDSYLENLWDSYENEDFIWNEKTSSINNIDNLFTWLN